MFTFLIESFLLGIKNLRLHKLRSLLTSLSIILGVAAVIPKVAKQLFPYQDPIGETIQVGTKQFGVVILTVIGVLEPTGLRAGSEGASMMRLDPNQSVYFPYTLARATFGDTIIRMQAGTFERDQI